MFTRSQEEVPKWIEAGRREAERTLQRFGDGAASLRTVEWVLPQAMRSPAGYEATVRAQPNRLIQADVLAAAGALLAGDAAWPSLRGRIGLVVADLQAAPDGDYLSAVCARLCLLSQLLTRSGAIYVRLDEAAYPYAAAIVEQLFGPDNPIHAFTGSDVTGRRVGSGQPSTSLLEAIILVSSDPHTLVADFFGGRGRTAIAAAQYGRRWIAVEPDADICMEIRANLNRHSNEPFAYQTLV